ncbi:MAG: [FeFe] hydrogenase H-cluster radical SAM maturase HydE [candidate division Zixibacteria bacterium]|nr:[FeFe] hydrogenase H-cluster radical SAM maturase HydE [candidate division Zixibacteria bacterium]
MNIQSRLTADNLSRDEIVTWLREENPTKLEVLWQAADECRRQSVGDEVHLRGLVEISNHCIRSCAYCGIRFDNKNITRYRMNNDEIFDCVKQAVEFGYGTVVLQAGEDLGLSKENIAALVTRIKKETPLAVTLSLGERDVEELSYWKKAGADRYLLRFETSNEALYKNIHPQRPNKTESISRIDLLKEIKRLGYETGSGVLIGIPGQSYDDLARDLELFRELDLDMIGVGPFIPHPDTPLGNGAENNIVPLSPESQVPNSELMTYKVVALSRLVCPRANIPSTTALATLNLSEGRELGLLRGANVLMPNLTPSQYRVHYEIYPDKACIREDAREYHDRLKFRIEAIGRKIGTGQGSAIGFSHK